MRPVLSPRPFHPASPMPVSPRSGGPGAPRVSLSRQAVPLLGLVVLLTTACAGDGTASSTSVTSPSTTTGPLTTQPGTTEQSIEPTTTNIPSTPPAAVTETRTLTHDGLDRSYRLHVPEGLPAGESVPLVLGFHGGLGWADQFAFSSNYDEIADRESFIVVYPTGVPVVAGRPAATWNGGYCCGPSARDDIDDVGFVAAVLDELEAEYPIDANQVFVVGHSNGGIISYRLACEMSDRIAAIGVVAGSLGGIDCKPLAAVSIIHIHGDEDHNHPIEGGVGEDSVAGVDFNSAAETLDTWIGLNACDSEPVEHSERSESGDEVQTSTWSGCVGDTEIEFVVIVGGSHAWPGSTSSREGPGGVPSQALDASETIWAFLATHAR